MASRRQPRSGAAASSSSAASSVVSFASNLASRIPRPAWYLFTFFSSTYFLTTFLISRLAAMHERMSKDAESKDGLKKRFTQNQNDIAFTVMALLPTLGKGVNERFDVDAITEELKKVGERGKVVVAAPAKEHPQHQQAEPQPTAAAGVVSEEPATSLAPSPQPASASLPTEESAIAAASTSLPAAPPSALDAVSEPFPPPIPSGATLTPTEPPTTNGTHQATNGDVEHATEEGAQPEPSKETAEPKVNGIHPAQPADDVAAKPDEAKVVSGEERKAAEAERQRLEEEQKQRAEEDAERLRLEEAERLRLQAEERQRLEAIERQRLEEEQERARLHEERLAADRKRKMELWSQLKITAISRALTTVYAVNLLSMLTHVQLNLLGRYAYLSSLARQPDDAVTPVPPANIALDPFEDAWAKANAPLPTASSSSSPPTQSISQESEERYLTFSWYFLHRGCQQLSDRVRSKVEEVMASVSLKTQLNHAETVAVLARIKRKIEYEYEGVHGEDEDEEEAGETTAAATATANRPDFPGFVPNETKMAMGSESLLPMPNGFPSSSAFEDESMMSVSVLSGSTSRSTRRGKRRRVHLLSYLLPTTPQGDLEVLHASGLLPYTGAAGPGSMEEYDGHLASLLDETRDVLESRDAAKVLRKCVNAAFDTLAEALRAPFGLDPSTISSLPSSPPQQSRIRELRTLEEEAEIRANSLGGKRLKLAAILPLLARQSSLALEAVPNEMLDAISGVKELKALSAVLYSAWVTTG